VKVSVYDFIIRTYGPNGLFEIGSIINAFLKKIGARDGLVVIECMGSTGALLVADPRAIRNIKEKELWNLVPVIFDWSHEGNAYAHLRSTVLGTHLSLPVREGSLAIGSNGIFFVENQCYLSRERHIYVTYIGL